MIRMISIEGIDKSGKGLVFKYLQQLGNYEHLILDRGPLSNYVFSKMFKRGHQYDIRSFSDILFVFLDVEKEDWEIRRKITGEQKISYFEHYAAYQAAINDFKANGCVFLRYNTSVNTPYQIAKDILKEYNILKDKTKC